MLKMHEGEIEITNDMVLDLIQKQCPEFLKLPIKRVNSSGTDNALFKLGEDYVARMPRIEWEEGQNSQKLSKEFLWLPKIFQSLSTPISKPLFMGKPQENYPWPWLVMKWYEGINPQFEIKDEYELLAIDLANFLNEFHNIKLTNGPLSRRGVHISEVNEKTLESLSNLTYEIDTKKSYILWNKFLGCKKYTKKPVWVHGDFLPGNILVKNNRLSAVIDFTDLGIGDPACDLVIAFSLFNNKSRQVFKNHLKNLDEDTWNRGKAWALSIGIIMLPYYKDSNPVLKTLAERMINNVLYDI